MKNSLFIPLHRSWDAVCVNKDGTISKTTYKGILKIQPPFFSIPQKFQKFPKPLFSACNRMFQVIAFQETLKAPWVDAEPFAHQTADRKRDIFTQMPGHIRAQVTAKMRWVVVQKI